MGELGEDPLYLPVAYAPTVTGAALEDLLGPPSERRPNGRGSVKEM